MSRRRIREITANTLALETVYNLDNRQLMFCYNRVAGRQTYWSDGLRKCITYLLLFRWYRRLAGLHNCVAAINAQRHLTRSHKNQTVP